MFMPLCDNTDHINQLCARFDLGPAQGTVSSLHGGFHHRVWKLTAKSGFFVVKQLSPDTDLNDETVIAHYNVTEAIASKFRDCGVAAICALMYEQQYLQLIDEEAYFVYPWTDAVALGDGKVSQQRALKVAQLLATMHQADIQVPGVETELAEASNREDVENMVQKVTGSGMEIAPMLIEQRSFLTRIAKHYQLALPLLESQQVISHGDLDQKNVLWDKDENPVIIDWESAHRMNPTREVINEALDWSGLTGDFNSVLYAQFISSYTAAGGTVTQKLIEAALHRILGEWLDWLMYNVGRMVNLEDPKQRALGEEQVELALSVMLKLDQLQPQLISDMSLPRTFAAAARKQ